MTTETPKQAPSAAELCESIRTNLEGAHAHARDGSPEAVIKGRDLALEALFAAFRIPKAELPEGFIAEVVAKQKAISATLKA